jgi:L-ascorbate metabolism protein UlaG (beta-lactamase superfamily)
MKFSRTVGAVCIALAMVATAGGAAGDAASDSQQAASVKAADAATLLAGVVHLSDDDIRFRTKSGVCVFVDPVNEPNNKSVIASGMVRPDLILITHRHGDHFQPGVLMKYLKLNPNLVIAGPADVVAASRSKKIGVSTVIPGQDYTMAGISFSTVPSYFEDPKNGHPKDKGWVGYVLKLDGARYYVTGDTGPLPGMAETGANVIFPLLAGCGGNLDQAVKMAEVSKARIVVPVHFHGGPGTPVMPQEEETVTKFIASLPKGVQAAYYKDAVLNTGAATTTAKEAPEAGK